MSRINSIPNETTATLFVDEFSIVTGSALLLEYDVNQIYGFIAYQGVYAVNNDISAKFNLSPGAYTLSILGITGSNYGITTVRIDGVSQGTIDWYSASTTYNQVKTLAVTVVGDQTHTISFRVASKNASSSNFAQLLTKAWIK